MLPCRDTTCVLAGPRQESQVDSANTAWDHIHTWCNEPADNLTDWCLIPRMQCIQTAKKAITYTKSFNHIPKDSNASGMHLFQQAHVRYRLQMNVSTSNNYFLLLQTFRSRITISTSIDLANRWSIYYTIECYAKIIWTRNGLCFLKI